MKNTNTFCFMAATALTALIGCLAPSPVPTPTPWIVTATPLLPSSVSAGQFQIPPTPRNTVSFCSDQPTRFITDFQVRQPLTLAEPKARVPFRDPIFGTCLVRVTDRKTDVSKDDRSTGMKNEYSRVQSFNADGSRLLVRGLEATWYVYDAQTLQPLMQVPLETDPRWDAANPQLLYYSDGTRLMAYHLDHKQQSVVHDFAADLPGKKLAAVWTRYEGSPSIDSRYWGLMAQDQDWNTIAFLVYDRQADRVIAKRDLPRPMSVDTVTLSPLGNYFLAYHDDYCDYGKLGGEANLCGLMVYDRNLKNGRGLLRIVGHSDVALDAQGREVLVYQDIDTDNIAMLDLATGIITPLWPIDFTHCDGCGMHFSGRAVQRPGWALVSYFDGDPASYWWMDDQVIAIELGRGGRMVRLAHHHSLVDPNQVHDY